MAKKKADMKDAPVTVAEPAPVPVDDRVVVYLEGIQDETGAFHPVRVDGYPHQFHVTLNRDQYYHCGDAPDGTWIYRKER